MSQIIRYAIRYRVTSEEISFCTSTVGIFLANIYKIADEFVLVPVYEGTNK